MTRVNVLAWVLALGSFVAFLVALQLGPSCADSAGPWCAGAFLAPWAWLAYRHERRHW